MESILVKHINMPQTSKHVKITGGTDLTATGDYTFDIVVPESAIVEKVNIVTTTAFVNGAGTVVAKAGDLNGSSDTMLAASTNIKSQGRVESGAGKQMIAVTGKAGDDNELQYVVRVTVTVATAAVTAGEAYVWADFRFDPNVAYS